MNMRWKTMRIVLAGAVVGLGVWWWAQERDASMLLEQQQLSYAELLELENEYDNPWLVDYQ